MQQRTFGKLGDISALTLGGGGTGQVWGPTTREEAIATVRAAWEAGITFFDVAPSYGGGEAEVVLGEAFGGRLPAGIHVSTKCAVGTRAAREVLPLLEWLPPPRTARMPIRAPMRLPMTMRQRLSSSLGRWPSLRKACGIASCP